jgi:hypothetical protein
MEGRLYAIGGTDGSSVVSASGPGAAPSDSCGTIYDSVYLL